MALQLCLPSTSHTYSHFCACCVLLPAASLLVSGDPDKGRSIADQETLATSINRLVGLLGQAQQYVDDVLVSLSKITDDTCREDMFKVLLGPPLFLFWVDQQHCDFGPLSCLSLKVGA